MMNIAVCIKQVPSSKAEIDFSTGNLIRFRENSVINPYDRYALEAALQLKEMTDGNVYAFSMGPESAEDVLREALAMGADKAILITDRAFSGADAYATAYTLSESMKCYADFDVIICGRQTTDGDTSQVGPEIAQMMDIPFCTGVIAASVSSDNSIVVEHLISDKVQKVQITLPCLITIERKYCVPRLPSIKNKIASRRAIIEHITVKDLRDTDASNYGQKGSYTKVHATYFISLERKCTPVEACSKTIAKDILSVLAKNYKGLSYDVRKK